MKKKLYNVSVNIMGDDADYCPYIAEYLHFENIEANNRREAEVIAVQKTNEEFANWFPNGGWVEIGHIVEVKKDENN